MLAAIVINEGLQDIANKTNPYGVARRLIEMILPYVGQTIYDELESGIILRPNNQYELYRALYAVGKGGHLQLVDHFIKLLPRTYATGIAGAAEGNHMRVIKYYMQQPSYDVNWGLYGAARGGHIELVEYFIEKGATDWALGFNGAYYGRHKNLIEFFKSCMGD